MIGIDFAVHHTPDIVHQAPTTNPMVKLVNIILSEKTRHLSKGRYDLIFAPGNSFGEMSGGFDQGIVDVWGEMVQERVSDMIRKKYGGLMPVGASEVVMVEGVGIVYSPTMMVPTPYTGLLDPYMIMRQSLIAVDNHEQKKGSQFINALCPLFCAGTGGSLPDVSLKQQLQAVSDHFAVKRGQFIGCDDLFKDGTRRYMELTRV